MNKRFSRQNKIGWFQQRKLKNTNVMIVGCGGIGCWTALQLTMLGVRKITLIDMDTIEESNLNRQFFYEEDIEKFKVDALVEKLHKINSKIKYHSVAHEVERARDELFKNTHFIFDCLDNIKTREYLLSKCTELNIPFIHSACSDVIGEAQLIIKGKTPVLKYPEDMKKADERRSCLDFDPAVVTTNMIVASLQVDKFLDYLMKKETKNPFTHYIRGQGLSYGGNLK